MKLNEFIELIKDIGFVEQDTDFSYEKQIGVNTLSGTTDWNYNGYTITIHHTNNNPYLLWFMYKDVNYLSTRATQSLEINNKRYFSLDEIGLLEKHFKSELRELKLKELGC